MSQQGPILIIANGGRPAFADALEEARMFPIVDARWADAASAVTYVQPAAILADGQGAWRLELLARQVARRKPYLPLIVVDPAGLLPENAIPFALRNSDRLAARLHAALRIRSLHATVLRRLADEWAGAPTLPDVDCARDATVLLIGRGGSYPRCRLHSANAWEWSAPSALRRPQVTSAIAISMASCSVRDLRHA